MLREAERKLEINREANDKTEDKGCPTEGGSRRRGGAWTTLYGIDRLRTDREFELTMEQNRGGARISETRSLFRDF